MKTYIDEFSKDGNESAFIRCVVGDDATVSLNLSWSESSEEVEEIPAWTNDPQQSRPVLYPVAEHLTFADVVAEMDNPQLYEGTVEYPAQCLEAIDYAVQYIKDNQNEILFPESYA